MSSRALSKPVRETTVREADLIEALQDITEAKGAFSRDHFEHAKNCIRDMAQTAIDVLMKHGITPRGNGPR